MSTKAGWHRYRRRGEVNAEKLPHEWTWTTTCGEQMRAGSGDWVVINDDGHERSVAADVFESTHERVGPGRYRRVGTVFARCATQRDIIQTLEGEVVANPGDWILRGSKGEQWVVPAQQFEDTYEGPLDAGQDTAQV